MKKFILKENTILPHNIKSIKMAQRVAQPPKIPRPPIPKVPTPMSIRTAPSPTVAMAPLGIPWDLAIPHHIVLPKTLIRPPLPPTFPQNMVWSFAHKAHPTSYKKILIPKINVAQKFLKTKNLKKFIEFLSVSFSEFCSVLIFDL